MPTAHTNSYAASMAGVDNLHFKVSVWIVWIKWLPGSYASNVALSPMTYVGTNSFAREVNVGCGQLPKFLKSHFLHLFDGHHVTVCW